MVSGLPKNTPIFSRSWLMKMAVVPAWSQRAGHLAQRLTHESGLQTNMAVSHFAFDFSLRHQSGDRVDDDDVKRTGANQHVSDFEGLLAVIRLGDDE